MSRHFFASALSLRVQWVAAAVTALLVGCSSDSDSDSNPATTCEPGSTGCACNAGACTGNGPDGQPLSCSAENVCVTQCTPGALGCVCDAKGECADAGDECASNVCSPKSDCTGELACACNAGACGEGLLCEADVCTATNALLVTLSGGDARACDLKVTTSSRRVVDVVFPAGVRGRSQMRDGVAAVSLIRTLDTPLAGTVAALVFEGADATDASLVSELKSTCYGRTGAADAAASAKAE